MTNLSATASLMSDFDILKSPLRAENVSGAPLAAALRDLMSILIPGDIILLRAQSFSIVTEAQQHFDFSPEAKQFSHVVLYVGSGAICHSTPRDPRKIGHGGVYMERLQEVLQPYSVGKSALKQNIVVLRGSDLSVISRMQIAIVAAAFSAPGVKYDVSGLFMRVAKALGKINDYTDEQGNYIASNNFKVMSLKMQLSAKKHDSGVVGVDATIYQDAAKFICTEFILACYQKVLRRASPFYNIRSVSPILLPAQLHGLSSLQKVYPLDLEKVSDVSMASTAAIVPDMGMPENL